MCMTKKHSFKYEELIDCANGKLFGPGNAKLPSPPMLMFNRITNIQIVKGKFNKGSIEAELDIKEKMWFFDCHFKEDPVMPGCLGLDAMWQLVGFYLGWIGEPGKGSFAFPGPNNFPSAQSINSSYLKLCFFVILIN